jgi:hypothetical protein
MKLPFRRSRPPVVEEEERPRDLITVNLQAADIGPDGPMETGPVIVVHQQHDGVIMDVDGVKAHAFGPFDTVREALWEIAVARQISGDDCYKTVMLIHPPIVKQSLLADDPAEGEADPMTVPDAEPLTGNGLGRIH